MTKKNNQLLMFLSVAGLMAFTACTDDKYDLGDLDTTIGIGNDSDQGLKLPTSSTKEIFLDDLLELNNSETVVIKENGDYAFQQNSNDVSPVHPNIAKIAIAKGGSTNIPVKIAVPTLPSGYDALPVGTPLPGTAGSIREEIQTFNYQDTYPEEIKSLKSADTEGSIDVTISFTEDLKGFISNFKTFNVELPQYMEIEVESTSQDKYDLSGNILKFTDTPTSKPLTIKARIKKLHFTEVDDNNKLTLDGSKNITMVGDVKVDATYDDAVKGSGNVDSLMINSTMTINSLTIVGATGSFSPKIEITDLGGVTLNDLPDFLTDGNVVVDLYNPQIIINLGSDLSIPGFLKGTLVAKDENGNVISRVAIPEVKINSAEENGGTSKILICRRDDKEDRPDGITDIAIVPELSNIIRKIPHTISFETEAHADDSRDDSYIKLDHDYTITPSYRIEAPIAFGKDARIVYNDTMDGWNDDIQDYEFANNSYLRVTTNIENQIPANLIMSAHAIDVNGKSIGNLTVDIDKTIEASTDGVTSKTTPITITIKQTSQGALKAVDGIVFTIEAAASDGNSTIEGITLNAKNHSLIAKDIEITLMGKIIIKSDD